MQALTTPQLTTAEQEANAISHLRPLTRELAVRDNHGIHVLLLWHPREDKVTVSVEDSRAGERFDLEVARDRALDAFYHPFAYATPTTTHRAPLPLRTIEHARPARAAMPQTRGGIMDPRDHDHDGRCTGRLRIVAGVLMREIICDDCGAVVQTLGSAGPYQLTPTGIERVA